MGANNSANFVSRINLAIAETTNNAKNTRKSKNDYEKCLVGRSYQLFRRGIKSLRTLEFYRLSLYYFCKFADMTTEEMASKYKPYVVKGGSHRPNVEGQIELQRLVENFVLMLQERVENKEIEPSTCVTRLPPVKLFFDMNDTVVLNWTRVNKLLPRGDQAADDEAYTREDAKRMLQHCDLRGKTLILFLASSGMRVEGISGLNDGDIKPMYGPDGRLLAAHLKVYASSADDSYNTFVTPEAYEYYMEFKKLRASYGEVFTKESPAFLSRFDKSSFIKEGKVKRIHRHTVQAVLLLARKKAGVTEISDRYNTKHFTKKTAHGWRKFFNTTPKSIKTKDGQSAISYINKERMLGHAPVGRMALKNSYDRTDIVKELLQDYLKATEALTITDEALLALQVTKLQEDVKTYKTLDAEFAQKDREIKALQAEMEAMENNAEKMIEKKLQEILGRVDVSKLH